MSELATILEHETMDFSSASGTPVDCERRASEPDMSHRGILDCIDSIEPTDSDSQHSSSEGSRGIVESLHSLSRYIPTCIVALFNPEHAHILTYRSLM